MNYIWACHQGDVVNIRLAGCLELCYFYPYDNVRTFTSPVDVETREGWTELSLDEFRMFSQRDLMDCFASLLQTPKGI